MDKVIIKMMKNNDEQAIKYIKDAYLPFIYYILNPFSLSQEDQEECVNDVLLKIWNGRRQLCEDLPLKNYVAIITRRVALNYIRKNKKKLIFYEDMDIFWTYDYYEKIDWSKIIKQLKYHERTLFIRHYYYFQSIETIALELGTTYKAIESRLYRLRKKLKKILNKEGYHGSF